MDPIDREKLLSIIAEHERDSTAPIDYVGIIKSMPTVDPEHKWIPFENRPLTEEEKEEYPDCDYILDCELPEDGQRILVNIKYIGHEAVQMDEYYYDDGCYLDSGYEICSEATAWMPLPEPYQEEGENDAL